MNNGQKQTGQHNRTGRTVPTGTGARTNSNAGTKRTVPQHNAHHGRPPKKNGNKKAFIIALIAAILVIAAVFCVIKLVGSDEKQTDGNTQSTSKVVGNKSSLPTDIADTVGGAEKTPDTTVKKEETTANKDDKAKEEETTKKAEETTKKEEETTKKEEDATSKAPETTADKKENYPTSSDFIPDEKTDEVITATLTETDMAFLKKSVFIGDSICSGLKVYDILPDNNVLAVGSVAARNIFDYGDGKFTVDGASYGILDALRALPYTPEYVIFSMGMNDINMTTEEGYTENYTKLISEVKKVLPNAKLVVCSITPISAESTFSTNEKIDRFNAALKNACPSMGATFVDVSTRLKGTDNCLKPSCHSGDGLHLAPDSYRMFLYSVCRNVLG